MEAEMDVGSADTLGACWDGRGVNFALFSAHAERVELCLFDPSGRVERERITLPGKTNEVWHGYLANAEPGTVYGYRVHGPYQPDIGHRFNPNKLLLDPYARELIGTVEFNQAIYGFETIEAGKDHGMSTLDSAPFVPKGVVVDDLFDWEGDCPPRIPWPQTVILETHVRGFTKRHTALPEAVRGCYQALASTKSLLISNPLA